MNDEAINKVDLFAGKSGEAGGGRTMHAHDEPPALSYKPGATFAPSASVGATQADQPKVEAAHDVESAAGDEPAVPAEVAHNTSPESSDSKISNKLDDLIANTHDEPIHSSVRTGNSEVDDLAGANLSVPEDSDLKTAKKPVDVVKNSQKSKSDAEVNAAGGKVKKEPEKKAEPGLDDGDDIDHEARLEVVESSAKKDDSEDEKKPDEVRSDDELRQSLADSYSSDREAVAADMPVTVERSPVSDKLEPAAETTNHTPPSEYEATDYGPKAIKLNNVIVAESGKKTAKDDAKKGDFPSVDHLSGEHAHNSAKQTTPLVSHGKKGVQIAVIAVVAVLFVGVGAALAYSPTRSQIVKIFNSKKATVNTNSPQVSASPPAEQTNSSNYSFNDYVNGMGGQKNDSAQPSSPGLPKGKATYSTAKKATASKKLTTTNIPTTVAPSVVGSTMPQLPVTQIVNDYIGIEGPCWETILPKDNQPFYNDWCIFGANYGAQNTANLQVLPYTAADKETFDSVIAYLKTGADPQIKLSSEAKIMIGGVEAQKLVFSGATGAESFPDVMVVVDFGRDRYSQGDLKARGFIIAGSYNDDFAKKSFDSALEYWNWK